MRYLATILLIAMSNIAIACDDFQKISNESKIGTWQSMDDPFNVTVIYKPDGTFTGNIVENGKLVWESVGVWWLIEGINYMVYTKSSSIRVPVGTVDHDKIISIGCDIYTYQSQFGKTKRYRRVQN